MPELTGKVIPININKEMRQSYLDYAMSVIVGRALPDVRDGLKPVHRRILYAMHKLGTTPDKPHRKSAYIVGEVMAKYHPHGDMAIYDTLVRLAQDFACRYPLVDGHGNFGSVDGDSPAAMRYTEARMAGITTQMLADIEKNTVDFIPNYDGSNEEPVVLPSGIPNLLINGSDGIAVGMATKIPPHNLGEVIDGLIKLIENPNAGLDEVMTCIKGPDFPSGATIMGRDNIIKAYRTGRGSIKVRANSTIEKLKNGKTQIVVNEIPYQVNKARLIEKIANLVRDKKIDGIADLRDESDRKGMRIVIELKRDVNPRVILNQLYKHTQLQDSYGMILLALVNGQPRILNLKQMLLYYLEHRKDVIVRRTRYDLDKAEARAHIVEGLRIALMHLDEVIKLIRSSRTVESAKKALMDNFGLSEKQAQAILDMRLQKLTGLERDKLEAEYKELIKKIEYFRSVLADERKVMRIVGKELLKIKEKYADSRRTIITDEDAVLEEEDLIPEEDVVITLTNNGYIKRTHLDVYKSQRRGGRGVTGLTAKNGDFVSHLFVTTTHHVLLVFTNKGKVYKLKVHEIPDAGRQARGTAIVNLLYLGQNETVTAVIPVKEFKSSQFLFMVTKNGIVKKTRLDEYNTSRKDGIIALSLDEKDTLINVVLTDGSEQVVLGTRKGMAIRFSEDDVRPIGRTARGVRGITLSEDDYVIGMGIARKNGYVMVVTEKGYGKKTNLDEYRIQSRAGKGIINYRLTEKNGEAVFLQVMSGKEEIMIISAHGSIIRLKANEIPVLGRVTQGVRLMRLLSGDKVVTAAKLHL